MEVTFLQKKILRKADRKKATLDGKAGIGALSTWVLNTPLVLHQHRATEAVFNGLLTAPSPCNLRGSYGLLNVGVKKKDSVLQYAAHENPGPAKIVPFRSFNLGSPGDERLESDGAPSLGGESVPKWVPRLPHISPFSPECLSGSATLKTSCSCIVPARPKKEQEKIRGKIKVLTALE